MGNTAHSRLVLTYTFNDEMDRPVYIFQVVASPE